MAHVRERYEDKVGYDRNQERSFDNRDSRDTRDSYYNNSRQDYYAESNRATSDDRYRNTYERDSYTKNNYDDITRGGNDNYSRRARNDSYSMQPASSNYSMNSNDNYTASYNSNSNASYSYNDSQSNNVADFAPIEMSDMMNDNAMLSKKAKKIKLTSKLSTKSKVFCAVYFGLVGLIVTMLLINTIPSVGAQTGAITPPVNVITDSSYDNAVNSLVGNGDITVVPPYNYDTETNWFDSFCDFFSGLFS